VTQRVGVDPIRTQVFEHFPDDAFSGGDIAR
jgi:hypothetical protein